MRRFKSFFFLILELIYYKGILFSVIYGILVWGNCSVVKLVYLEKIYFSVVKFIFKLFEIFGLLIGLLFLWKFISYLYKLKFLCLIYKIFYGVCFEKISFIIKKSFIFRNMRDNLKFIMESFNINIGR